MQEAGDDDVFRKVRGDFDAAGVRAVGPPDPAHHGRADGRGRRADRSRQLGAASPDMTLAARLRAGETLFTAWSAIPDPLVAEFLARTGFDAVTLDMQHGCHSTESVLRGVAAITLAGKPAVVRIPVGALRHGEPRARFRRRGGDRADGEFGRRRARLRGSHEVPAARRALLGTDARARAARHSRPAGLSASPPTSDTLAIAMIETRAAQAALDDILARRRDRRRLRRPVGFLHRAVGRRADRSEQRGDAGGGAEDRAKARDRPERFACTLAITARGRRGARATWASASSRSAATSAI